MSASTQTKREELQDWSRFIRAEAHILLERPRLLFQQAANQADTTTPARMAQRRFEAGLERRFWLRLINKPAHRPACLMTLVGHGSTVTACAFSPDGSRIVSGSDDLSLKLWDAKTGAELATLVGHRERVNACAFSPDGSRMLSASDDKTVRLWDAVTGAEIRTFTGLRTEVEECSFSPDGQRILASARIVTRGFGWSILWDADTGVVLGEFLAGSPCAFLPDGARILSLFGFHNGVTGERLDCSSESEGIRKICEARLAGKQACAFSLDRTRLISLDHLAELEFGNSQLVKVLDVESQRRVFAVRVPPTKDLLPRPRNIVGEWIHSKTGPTISDLEESTAVGHRLKITACAFSPDAAQVLTGSADNTLKLWDCATGTEVARFVGHSKQVNACGFSPDGKHILSCSDDGTLKLWDADAGLKSGIPTGHTEMITSCVCSRDGAQIATASADKTLRLWDAKTGRETKALTGHGEIVNACAFSPDGKRLVSASAGRKNRRSRLSPELLLWDAESGSRLGALVGNSDMSPGRLVWASHRLFVWTVYFALAYVLPGSLLCLVFYGVPMAAYQALSRPFGDFIHDFPSTFGPVLLGVAMISALWGSFQGAAQGAIGKGPRRKASACCFSSDGGRIVVGMGDGSVKIFDAATGSELATLARYWHGGWRQLRMAVKDVFVPEDADYCAVVNACSFSPDGTRILYCVEDGKLELLDALTGRRAVTLPRLKSSASTCAFSPSGLNVASGGGGKWRDRAELVISDSVTGKLATRLVGHTDKVTALAYSPDAKLIVSCSRDATLRLWDSTSGTEVFACASSFLTAVDWHPDGSLIVAGGDTGGLFLWRLEGSIPGGPLRRVE